MAMTDLISPMSRGKATTKPEGSRFEHGAKPAKGSGFDMTTEDFMTLILAQFQNQDIMNPASTDDFLNQMIQMMTIQTMTNMNDISTISYAASLVGKEVTIGVMGKKGMEEIVGVVTGTGMMNGQQVIIVNGKEYALNQILAIGRLPEKPDEPQLPTPGNPDPNMGVDPENPEGKPEKPDGEVKPEKPDGEVKPEKPDGEAKPEKPDSEVKPEKPDGEIKPEKPENETKPEGEKQPDSGTSGPTI